MASFSLYLVCHSFPPSFSLLLLLVWSFSEENSPFYHPAVIVFFKNKSFEFHVIHVRERQKWKNNENQMLVRSFFFRINFGSLRLLFSQQQNHFSTSKLNKPQLFNILIIHPGITPLSTNRFWNIEQYFWDILEPSLRAVYKSGALWQRWENVNLVRE